MNIWPLYHHSSCTTLQHKTNEKHPSHTACLGPLSKLLLNYLTFGLSQSSDTYEKSITTLPFNWRVRYLKIHSVTPGCLYLLFLFSFSLFLFPCRWPANLNSAAAPPAGCRAGDLRLRSSERPLLCFWRRTQSDTRKLFTQSSMYVLR